MPENTVVGLWTNSPNLPVLNISRRLDLKNQVIRAAQRKLGVLGQFLSLFVGLVLPQSVDVSGQCKLEASHIFLNVLTDDSSSID